ncbi:DAK2 domain-containing protein [Mangrovibacillus cuniculi]|uniref:DAK2 domain-containing protein n=1 Tax=Mangrovibacillus cuniculi TaxID=2593652 RepID=A0A7S8CAA2_9BACI|nr:DAK2 domain-containing protein [Mangrovibacillus cuniculi]QPC46306.1 DAK2 domain-containing protein [Mangrovibacillus cuniculi]
MSITSLDGMRFGEMVLQGANNLSAKADMVDALNVFPVPDGDTGTNMNLSMTSGAKEVKQHMQPHVGKVAQALAKGLLMGARGNSGVILSQLFRGFGKSIENKETINSVEFAQALEAGVETAYKAVMKPVEGTILTVARETAKQAVEIAKTEKDIVVFFEKVVDESKKSLNRTPDLLPVLKEVGVVDSGGQGLVCVYEGFLAELKGEELPDAISNAPSMDELVKAEHHKSIQGFMDTEDIEFGYCTEFMVKFEKEKLEQHPYDEVAFRNELSQWGDSLLVVSDDEIVKVHIHAEEPGTAMNLGQRYGSFIAIKVENMRQQHSSLLELDEQKAATPVKKEEKKKDYAIVTVSMGEGIADLFRSIGASHVIEGGQTMNPSTEDIVKAIEEVHAEKVFILPNNKNIIMAAEQAASVAEVEAVVVPTKTVPQGMAAMLAFNPMSSLEQNKDQMTESLAHVKTGQVTHAVRDTTIDGLTITSGDFMGISEGKIVKTNTDLLAVSQELLSTMLDDESEILTILKGEDADAEVVDALVSYVEDAFEDVEVEVHDGKQPLYPFIFSVE